MEVLTVVFFFRFPETAKLSLLFLIRPWQAATLLAPPLPPLGMTPLSTGEAWTSGTQVLGVAAMVAPPADGGLLRLWSWAATAASPRPFTCCARRGRGRPQPRLAAPPRPLLARPLSRRRRWTQPWPTSGPAEAGWVRDGRGGGPGPSPRPGGRNWAWTGVTWKPCRRLRAC